MSPRTQILTAILLLLVMIVPASTSLALSAVGRQANVNASRAACYRSGPRNAAAANEARAAAIANHLVATDPKQSARTRHARANEVGKDIANALTLDSQTDQALWHDLDNPIDQANVRYGMPILNKHGHMIGRTPAFHCTTVFPPAQFIP